MTADLSRPFAGCSWRGVVRRSAMLAHLDPHVLLHAGPPLDHPMSAAIRHAAAQAIVFEGMAQDLDDALDQLARGVFRLQPAQDHGVVTPLAHVVSASMPLAVVGDDTRVMLAPLVEGGAPALRFGSTAPECRARLEDMTRLGLSRLDGLLARNPVAIAPVIADAVAAGDECHARTAVANEAMVRALHGLNEDETSVLRGMPGAVLPVLMAAAAWALQSHAGQTPGAIVGAGGNGVRFGLRLNAVPGWQTVFATPPRGPLFAGPEQARIEVLPAIGDSAVIDFCGLGGQALHASPALLHEWQDWLPADAATRHRQVLDPHTGLVDAARVVASGQPPWVNLAMLDIHAQRGLVGRGFYQPPLELFSRWQR